MLDTEHRNLLSAHFGVWQHLNEAQREALLEHAVFVHYAKGAHVHSGEQRCAGLFLLKSGTLRVYMLSGEGREITLYRLSAGDTCVLSASCVLSAITFEVHIDAETDTDLILVSAPFFASLSEQNIYAECFAYKLAAERFSDVMWAMQQILFMSMDKRLAVFLWDELAKAQSDTLHLTHDQVARYMGSAREVVTRMLKYFAGEGIVELSRGDIHIIDKQKLRQLTL